MTRMMQSDTLIALIEGVTPEQPYLGIDEAEIELPMMVRMVHGRDGPAFVAHPPYSAYRSGVEPVVHRTRIRIKREQTPTGGPTENPADPAPNPSE